MELFIEDMANEHGKFVFFFFFVCLIDCMCDVLGICLPLFCSSSSCFKNFPLGFECTFHKLEKVTRMKKTWFHSCGGF